MENVNYLCGLECDLGADYGKSLGMVQMKRGDADGLQYLFFPETKGLQLEDVDRLFAKKEDWSLGDQMQKATAKAEQVETIDE